MNKTPLSSLQQHNLSTVIYTGDISSVAVIPDLTAIYTLTEYKVPTNSNIGVPGKPVDGKIDLDYIFNYIIDDLVDTGNSALTIGRQVVINADFVAATNNTLIANLFTALNDTIDYEALIDVNTATSATIISALTDIIGLDTEDADLMNLCVTKYILDNVIKYINTYANKFFRNLNQLIRVKRDWRLYGPGATISGNYLATGADVSSHTTVPTNCFKQFGGGYVAGNRPYGISTEIGAPVTYFKDNISPATVYTAAPHTHLIQIIPPADTSISATVGPWIKPIDTTVTANFMNDYANGTYRDHDPYWGGGDYWVYAFPGDRNRSTRALGIIGELADSLIEATMSVRYGSGPKYLATVGTDLNGAHIPLPAYNTYVWQWQTDDTTQLF